MSVAPEGREGVFTAMASAPLFLGKFVTGAHSAVFALSVSSADCERSMQQRDQGPVTTEYSWKHCKTLGPVSVSHLMGTICTLGGSKHSHTGL